MTGQRHIGLERQDGLDVGRDPRTLSADELEQLGHARVSPLRALRLKCLGVAKTFAQTARLCAAVCCLGPLLVSLSHLSRGEGYHSKNCQRLG